MLLPPRPRHARALPLVAAVAVLACGRLAGATAEGEWMAAVSAGYAVVRAEGRRPGGGRVELEIQRGITDAWSARVGLGASLHVIAAEGAEPASRLRATSLSAGFTYAVDIVRVVPFLDLGVGLLSVSGQSQDSRRALGVEVGLGAEYLLTRRWTLALLGRYQYAPLRLCGSTESDSTLALGSVLLRLGRIF
jgi:opacity protein-like surface antigen